MSAAQISKQLFALLLSVGLLATVPPAKAELIGTQQLMHPAMRQKAPEQDGNRATIRGFLARNDVQKDLQKMGLNREAIQGRLAALSDAEVAALAQKINALPAAGALGFHELVIILLVAILVALAV